MSKPLNLSPETDERFTPPWVFKTLHRLFQFTLDPCTTEANPLAMLYFFTKAENGLLRSWACDGVPQSVFVNPPYSNIPAWVNKAVSEAKAGNFIAFLIPSDNSTQAYRMLAAAAWGRWEIPFRVKFLTVDGKQKDTARGHTVFFLGGLP